MTKHDWFSERILFGCLIIGGYFVIGGLAVYGTLNDRQISLTRDVLLTIGPLLGVIVNSIWRTDKVDKLNANTAAVLADKTPDLSGKSVTLATSATDVAPEDDSQDLAIPPKPTNPFGKS